MGACLSSSESNFPPNYHVYVNTGERKGAGTSSSVFIAFYNTDGTKSPEVKHACRCLEEFKAGTMKSFPIAFDSVSDFGRVRKIEIGIEKGNEWYVERIEVENVKSKEKDIFPVHRWIKADKKMMLTVHDCTLPQNDDHKDQRRMELEAKKRDYEFLHVNGMIPNIKKLPRDEEFDHVYESTLDKIKYRAILETVLVGITHRSFRSIDDIKSIYTNVFPYPEGIDDWKEDRKFGALRLVGLKPVILRLCTDIPVKFPVTDDLLKEFLGGMTINEAIEKKRLFIIDYAILKDLPCTKNAKFPAPLALFFLNDSKDLMPVAIQLFQDPAEDNPIFLPSDPEYTWMAAKMWFNLADGSHHQSTTHLGSTHLLIGAVCVATHRCLSPSHPIFRLMAPHFLHLIAMNVLGLGLLFQSGGWVDQSMVIGVVGMIEIIRRGWKEWRLDLRGNLPKEMEDRGVADPEVLPNYHYRDDAMLLWNAIKKYVSAVVKGNYEDHELLLNDHELQDWADTLSSVETGVGIQGVPGGGKFETLEHVIDTVTSFIFISSVTHAAVNFGQYNTYGFPPQYPVTLMGTPPKDKAPLKEADIVKMLPGKMHMLNVLVMTTILSTRAVNSLGDFEVEYQFDPIGTKAHKAFQEELKEIGATLESRYETRSVHFPYLHPKDIPNSISI